MPVTIIKSDGTREPFQIEKLKRSLRRSGASTEEVKTIVAQIEKGLHDNMQTREIYSKAFDLLRNSDAKTYARYSMRRALFGLGPTGFPFEEYMARLFTAEGYETKTGITLKGKCAEHELDVAGCKPDHSFVAEAKFHSRPGLKSDLQVVLYSFARYHDLQGTKVTQAAKCGITDLFVITNTDFTSTARDYAECVGLKLLSWHYPKENNLHDYIQRNKLYPITVLSTLSNTQKKALLFQNVVTCNDLVKRPQVLRHAHVGKAKTEKILAEAQSLCR